MPYPCWLSVCIPIVPAQCRSHSTCVPDPSTALAYEVYHYPLANQIIVSHAALLAISATVYFISNAGSIAAVISLTERRPLTRILVDCYFWSFLYYLVGAGITGIIAWLNRTLNWETSLLVLPAVYLIYRSYRLYLGKLEDEKRHVEEMANLHLRTIEALALAIEAKDHTTHEHLQRVRVYAIEVAKELGVKGPELEALHAAALLLCKHVGPPRGGVLLAAADVLLALVLLWFGRVASRANLYPD